MEERVQVLMEKESVAKRSGGRFASHACTFKSTWEHVAQALWKRYPNPFSKHVLSEDVIYRTVKGKKLTSRRIFTKTNKAPKFLERFVKTGSVACVVEESSVDASARTFTTFTKNINFANWMTVEEKCVYYVSPENKEWTCCKKDAWIKCGVFGISRAVEKFGFERYKRNVGKAEMGLEHVIQNLFKMIQPSQTNS